MFRRLILAALIATGTAHAADLPEPIGALLQAAHIPLEGAGIVVLRGDTTLVSHNAQQSMQPASTMKLFTTLTALEQLGPAFRGRTEFRSSAEVVNGVLQGDLILRGGGDVDLNEDVLLHMLQALRNQGIRKIKGDVILDRLLFQPARSDVGQPPFDEFPWAYYNVIPDALLTNTNLLKVEMRSTGNKIGLVMMPEMDKVSIRSDMKLSDAPCASWEQGWRSPDVARSGDKIEVVLHGSYPKNCIKSTSVDVLDHHDYLERLLRATWRKLGGSIVGDVREAGVPAATDTPTATVTTSATASDAAAATDATPADAPTPAPATRLLAEHVSRPLPEMLRDINKFSDNTLARTVFLMLGSLQADPVLGSRPIAPDGSQASTPMRAETAIRGWLQNQRIDANGLVFDNGSGLSRTERTTPAQLAGVLQAGLKSLWMPEFLSSLPIAATDGTMRKRLKDSPAALRARIKTGSLKSVIAIAGYVTDANNQPCIVVAILNDEHVANGAGRTVLDGVIDWVSRSK
ncbi:MULTISPECIES: D-alanyl-D-alanine carboxypeptidase/D-alanyl-D-alanine-endopeptidase [unclassified Duganella]|uniref:D-alanyl-D-alanine carboxypeptidase/D-alanyl-D-alanine-endopeptidase n=1 Tax=unclassified Duganella TaxID=2636909 RepID=UPI000E35705C|nr:MULTISPECIES: D-alanyl-D-alanine carboxypeptidase/D-alanyl-D-alanine-endopeptidase [unclassified Duganella]RFP12999.1 D-alanyl-D-alanine carboxypeptidase [Duganella sp. BJB475]RFP29009.1 D-alanyl-D-alanine carboxypeptidase [Duganella sp. BJB476]